MHTIAVTGANGEFGRGVVDHLSAAGRDVVATARNPVAAADLAARGIPVRPGDFDDPATLAQSLRGVDTVLINAMFVGADVERRGGRFIAAIGAATEAGVKRIVLTSWPEATTSPMFGAADYVAAEEALRTAGPDWTIVREGVTLVNPLAKEVSWAIRSGRMRAPAGDSRCAPAAPTDLIEATARIVAEPMANGNRFEFTGPRSVSWTEIAEIAGEIAGHPVPYETIDDETFAQDLRREGLPETAIPGWLDFHAAFRSGWGSHARPDLAVVLGRAPVDTREAIRRHVSGN
ncbi:NAD(P)H-binding protein [Streptomyces sp. NPDC059568]|uniref:NAD(P)H-binding protein n=1 Tax=Streptomyces sp. NPDC059568 TaxID=3346868 RepID=UPI00369DA70D